VVARFLGRRQDFAARPCGPILAARGIPIEAELHLRLSPAIHHTDGFFAAVLERAERAGEADRGAGVSVGSTP
jgi:16S rRNA (cytosine967-C5)-methyltransferase